MTPEQEALLKEIFDDRVPTILEIEIFNIISEWASYGFAARIAAEQVYEHLKTNVMRESDLMNYEGYREHKKNKQHESM